MTCFLTYPFSRFRNHLFTLDKRWNRRLFDGRKLVIRPAPQFSAIFLLAHPSPLFEEERNSLFTARFKKAEDPFLFEGARPRTAFAANDHPMDVSQIDLSKVLQQRFHR